MKSTHMASPGKAKQYKTTLKKTEAEQFEAFCKESGKRESEVIREAIGTYLQSALTISIVDRYSDSGIRKPI